MLRDHTGISSTSRRVVAGMAVVVACGLLAACGAQPTRHGAPPYETSSPAATAAPLKTRYPGIETTFTLPTMAGQDIEAISALIEFEVAAVRSLRTAKLDRGLRKLASGPVVDLIRSQTVEETALKYTQLGATRVSIRSVDTMAYSTVRMCVFQANRYHFSDGITRDVADKRSSVIALIYQRPSGSWYVRAIGNTKRKLRNCG